MHGMVWNTAGQRRWIGGRSLRFKSASLAYLSRVEPRFHVWNGVGCPRLERRERSCLGSLCGLLGYPLWAAWVAPVGYLGSLCGLLG